LRQQQWLKVAGAAASACLACCPGACSWQAADQENWFTQHDAAAASAVDLGLVEVSRWLLLSLVLQVSPDQQQQQQQGAEEACMLPPAQVDLSFVVQGKQGAPQQHVAVVVSVKRLCAECKTSVCSSLHVL
jgi:hypothetical protein